MAKTTTGRVVAFPGDLHCGHAVGLTPPDWRLSCGKRSARDVKKIRATQDEAWERYVQTCQALKPDVAIWMGDLIDGRGERSGGCELLTSDRTEQCEMAAQCIFQMAAPVNVLIRGTSFHTGAFEQFEDAIPPLLTAERLSCDGPHDHEQLKIDGVVFDVKHKVGSSSIPHGGWTPLAKEDLWQLLYADAGLVQRADWVVRGHTHTHLGGWRMAGDQVQTFVSTPALQCMGSRFGKQQCSKLVDWGVFAVRIANDRAVPIMDHIRTIGAQASAVKVI